MTGATHPFFGNQYTDGGYITGSFKFPEGLKREVGERIIDIAVPYVSSENKDTIPLFRETSPLKTVEQSGTKSDWVIPMVIITAFTVLSGYLAYKYLKKKRIINLPNIGVCEKCGEPLTGAELIPNRNYPFIICLKCGEKNYAKYSSDEITENPNGEDGRL